MSKRPSHKSRSMSKPTAKSKPVVKPNYICEGYINEVKFDGKGKTTISILATENFFVPPVKDGDKKKLLLLQNDAKTDNAVLIDMNTLFLVEKIDAEALLFLKVNRLKIRLEFDSPGSGNKISSLCVL